MSKKRSNRHHKSEQESKFEFEDAKDLTVGQAIRKNEGFGQIYQTAP